MKFHLKNVQYIVKLKELNKIMKTTICGSQLEYAYILMEKQIATKLTFMNHTVK